MLHSKEDYINCLNKIISPLKEYYTPGCAGIKCGSTGAYYSDDVARFEAFARILWGLAPLWGGGENSDLDAVCLQGIINGTDPESPEYWGEICDHDQKIVEVAAIGLALILAPHKVWDPLTARQKENFHKWLSQVNGVHAVSNNWKFFAPLANLGLKTVGAPYSDEIIKHGIECYESYYRDGGWYRDGNSEQADYYIAFAMHFYTLIYAKVMEKDDPEGSARYKERASLFAKDFVYWFAPDGAALAFGRSLTYRFAQVCFWSACVFAGVEPFPIGVIKGIISRNLEWWMSKPIFDNGGILSIGYAYPNLIMSESYNAYGSPYWALKSFLILALDADHEFFKVDALPLPELEPVHEMPQAEMIIQRSGDDVVALTSGQWADWNPTHCAEKYSKFAYSAKYAFSVPHSATALAKSGCDSMLAFDIDGVIFTRRRCLEHKIENGKIYSKWSPYRGILVETVLIPTERGHIRRHTVTSDIDCMAFDCAFSTPTAEEGGISGTGEQFTYTCEANTNLIHPTTKMQVLRYKLSKGINHLECEVVYPE